MATALLHLPDELLLCGWRLHIFIFSSYPNLNNILTVLYVRIKGWKPIALRTMKIRLTFKINSEKGLLIPVSHVIVTNYSFSSIRQLEEKVKLCRNQTPIFLFIYFFFNIQNHSLLSSFTHLTSSLEPFTMETIFICQPLKFFCLYDSKGWKNWF